MDKITLGHGLLSPVETLCGNKILQELRNHAHFLNSDHFVQETVLPTINHEDPYIP